MSEQTRTLEKLLSAAKLHIPFDGWGDVTFNASCADADLDPQIARLSVSYTHLTLPTTPVV